MISEDLQERIWTYLNPVIENARNYIIKKAQEVCESTTLDELQTSYDELFTLLSNKTIQHNSFVYEDLDITKKLIPTK
jgi:antitoxin component YwqK of YwqJK toxin-antitoxin module